MLTDICTVAFIGVSTVCVAVQVHVVSGIPAFNIVGMPDKVVAESRERIRAALSSINASLPSKRITVNLSPASLFKEGSHYDLPIALGILSLMGVLRNPEKLSSYVILGELALDGRITPVPGVFAASVTAKKLGKGIICPNDNCIEAKLVGNDRVLSPQHLALLIQCLDDDYETKVSSEFDNSAASLESSSEVAIPDMKDVLGHVVAKRAVEIAAAGGHNLLMVGPPGAGKSMLAKRLPGILPDLTPEEIIDVNVISSITKNGIDSLTSSRPFREPHSSASLASMVGGGKKAMPGEITLAHHGVLFLDELPEFSKSVLDALRQPLEDRRVVISRANAHVTYPANFQLIAAMNPCRCGYFNDVHRRCSRIPRCAAEYQGRISGPIMSRIDIKVEVENTSVFSKRVGEKPTGSAVIKKRVTDARSLQSDRAGKNNALLSAGEVEVFIFRNMSNKARSLLSKVLEAGNLSNRDSVKILKLSRTVADLAQVNEVGEEHIAEAASLFDRVALS